MMRKEQVEEGKRRGRDRERASRGTGAGMYLYTGLFFAVLSRVLSAFSDPITLYSSSRCHTHPCNCLKRMLTLSQGHESHIVLSPLHMSHYLTHCNSWLEGVAYSAYPFSDICAILMCVSIIGLFCAIDALDA